MRTTFVMSFIVMIFLFNACRNNEKKEDSSSKTEQQAEPAGSLLVKANPERMDSLYDLMTEIPLPFVYNENFIVNAPGFISLPESMFSLFHNFDTFDKDTRIAKLPQKGIFKPLVVLYQDENGSNRMNIYSLSDSMQVVDRLQIYSVEEINGKDVIINQTYEISGDYKIVTRKSLNGQVIEQLTYTLDEKRCFEELRNGKYFTIAYESPDDIHYTIESFIWDYNSNGGLIKKDLKRSSYRITSDFRLEKIDDE